MGIKVHDGIKVVSPNGLITKTINTSDDGYLTIPSPQFSDAINLTGGQIKFPATQVASSDANTLDDYEEGTFTPTLTAVLNCSSLSLTSAKYTKIGRLVVLTAMGYFTITATNALTSFIFTLPFNQSSNAESSIGSACLYSIALGIVVDDSGATANAGNVQFPPYSVTQNGSSKAWYFTYTYISE